MDHLVEKIIARRSRQNDGIIAINPGIKLILAGKEFRGILELQIP